MGFEDLWRRHLRRRVLGTDHAMEYLCVSLEGEDLDTYVTLTDKASGSSIDVSNRHLFLGLRPLNMGFDGALVGDMGDEICMTFTSAPFRANTRWRGFSSDSSAYGRVALHRSGSCSDGDFSVSFFDGVRATHQMIDRVRKTAWFARRVRWYVQRRVKDNIGHPGNNYDQIRLAYSVPRLIRVMTVGKQERFNLFPIDLGGPIGQGHYVIALRHGSYAGRQLEAHGRIVESQVEPRFAPVRYGLGHNHMKDPRPIDELERELELRYVEARDERWPLPEAAVRFRLLEVASTYDSGVHRFYLCRIAEDRFLDKDAPRLAHLHLYGAIRRDNDRIQTNYVKAV